MRSGELARAGGVNVETLRYYERRGLLAKPPRLASGYRQYPPEALSRLRMIKQAQALGLTLTEIAELLSLRPQADVTCGDMEARIRSKISELDTKLTNLTQLRRSLESLLCDCCDSQHATTECPALSRQPD